MINVSDLKQPTLISNFTYPNINIADLSAAAPFGPHILHESIDPKPRLEQRGFPEYCCYSMMDWKFIMYPIHIISRKSLTLFRQSPKSRKIIFPGFS